MGDRDLLKPLLERKGSVHFGRVLMKPGKPLTFATLDLEGKRKLLVFGLPGKMCERELGYTHSTIIFNTIITHCASKRQSHSIEKDDKDA
jgi:hypothetical protein